MQTEIAHAPPDPCFGSVSVRNLRRCQGADLRSRTVKFKLRHEPILDIGCAQARDHCGDREKGMGVRPRSPIWIVSSGIPVSLPHRSLITGIPAATIHVTIPGRADTVASAAACDEAAQYAALAACNRLRLRRNALRLR